TLVAKGSLQPGAIYTNVDRVLSVRDFVSPPVALVLTDSQSDTILAGSEWRVDAAHAAGSHLAPFELGRNRLAVSADREADRQAVLAHAAELAAFVLAEPFDRIHEAVEEAHKSNRQAA